MRLLILALVLPVLVLDYIMFCGILFLLSWIFTTAKKALLISLIAGLPLTYIIFRRGKSPKAKDNLIGKMFFDQCTKSINEGLDEKSAVEKTVKLLTDENESLGSWLSLELGSIIKSNDQTPGYLIKGATICLMVKIVLESPHTSDEFPDKVMKINDTVKSWYLTYASTQQT
jgi:hypothetical protein